MGIARTIRFTSILWIFLTWPGAGQVPAPGSPAGKIRFNTRINYEDGLPARMFLRDFNGDKKLDVLTYNLGAAVYLGNGDGTFTPGLAVTEPVSKLIEIGDVTGDGILDLLTVAGEGPSQIWKGKGDGTFEFLAVLPGFPLQEDLAIADFDGDGKNDVAATYNTGTVVFFNQGSAVFQLGWHTPNGGHRLDGDDVDGDGAADLVSCDRYGSTRRAAEWRSLTSTATPSRTLSPPDTEGSSSGSGMATAL